MASDMTSDMTSIIMVIHGSIMFIHGIIMVIYLQDGSSSGILVMSSGSSGISTKQSL